MKKLTALMLIFVLCFSLYSCAVVPAQHTPDMIIGTWTFVNGYTLTFNEDSTGKMVSLEKIHFTWSYNAEYDCYECIMANGKPFEVTYEQQENGQTVIYAWDTPGVKIT